MTIGEMQTAVEDGLLESQARNSEIPTFLLPFPSFWHNFKSTDEVAGHLIWLDISDSALGVIIFRPSLCECMQLAI